MAAEHSLGGASLHDASPIEGLADLIEPGSLLEATPECLVITAADGRIVFANRRAQELTGFDRAELVDRPVDFLLTDGLTHVTETTFETQCRRADADPIAVEVHLGHIDGRQRLLVVTLRDMTELKEGREARFEAEAKYRALVDEIPAVVYLDPVDENADSIYVSPQVTDADRRRTRGVARRTRTAGAATSTPTTSTASWDEYVDAYTNHTTLNHEYRMVHEDGTVKWVMEQATTVRDERRRALADPGRDLRHHRAQGGRGAGRVPRLPRQAHRPAEPGAVRGDARDRDRARPPPRPRRRRAVPGPRQLQARERLAGSPRGGRAAAAARRASARMHARDRPGGPPGRRRVPPAAVGPRAGRPAPVPATDAAMLVAESVATARARGPARAVRPGRHRVLRLGLASGSACSRRTRTTPRRCCATPTLRCTRASGPRRAATSCSRPTTTTPWRCWRSPRGCGRAVEQQNWVLHYQPIVDLGDGRMIGVEALVRWQDPNGGIVPPGEFIPLAEEMGLIEAIGDWVIDELSRAANALATAGAGPGGQLQPVAPPAVVGEPRRSRSSESCRRPASTPAGSSWRSPSPPRWPTRSARSGS